MIASGSVIRVPEEAATIQNGLDLLLTGDTLLVDRGTYEELLVAPAIEFTMLGVYAPDSGETARPIVDASEIITPDTTAVLTIPPSSVPGIHGFRLIGGAISGIRSWADSVCFSNCVIDTCDEGFRQVQDSINARAYFENCEFRGNRSKCAIVRAGNRFHAHHSSFVGGESSLVMLSLSRAILDSCFFSSEYARVLLYVARDSFIRGCVFQASTTPPFESLVLLGGTNSTIVNCVFSDISYGYHALTVSTEHLDSVTISDNTFRRCHAQDIGLMGEGAVIVHSLSDATQLGPIVSGNLFTDNSGNNLCDDIRPSIETPARISGNRFENSAGNGLPAISGSTSPWQTTPITLRDNRFENCGFALHGSVQTDARFNYWGHNSGPFHEFDNPQGLGDTITGPVQFIPWLEDSTDATGSFPEAPDQFSLQVYPNPFNSTVTLEYDLTREQRVKLEIYDVLGRKVETLVDEMKIAGKHNAHWNADEFASGVYFARFTLGNQSASQAVKLMLLK